MLTHVYTNSAVKEIYHIHLLYSKKMTPVGWKHKRYRVYIYNVFILRPTEFLETGVYNLHIYIVYLFTGIYFIYLFICLFIYLFIYFFLIPELLKVG